MKKVYVRYDNGVPESENSFSAYKGFFLRGIETQPFDDVCDVKEPGYDVGIVGYISDVSHCLKNLNIPVPKSLDYPDSLKQFFGRWIDISTVGEVRNKINPGIFIKPVKHKLFNGFVMSGSYDDVIKLSGYDSSEHVWISQAIDFISEYRCFVLNNEIIDIRKYSGRWDVFPCNKTISEISESWCDKPSACVIDVGVSSSGHTHLVEVNDGYSFGSYGLNSILYSKMLETRWKEIISKSYNNYEAVVFDINNPECVITVDVKALNEKEAIEKISLNDKYILLKLAQTNI